MASNEETWIIDIINDFIHSSIWLSPIQTFIDANCACFDYDDDIQSSTLLHEQKNIFQQYQNLVHSLLKGLSEDLKLNSNELNNICHNTNNSIAIDDSYEQLYSSNDLKLFIEMMKRKNLILQLQALVNLQMESGLMKQNEINDDQILQLLLQATSTEPMKNISSNIKQQDDDRKEMKKNIDVVPEEILRDKLRELSLIDDNNTTAILSRKNFLQQQRDLIINKQRNQRSKELEKEINHIRPQSAANIARQAMKISNEQINITISNDELEKRRAMAEKLRREVVNKR